MISDAGKWYHNLKVLFLQCFMHLWIIQELDVIQPDSPVFLIVPSCLFVIVEENHRCLAADVKA